MQDDFAGAGGGLRLVRERQVGTQSCHTPGRLGLSNHDKAEFHKMYSEILESNRREVAMLLQASFHTSLIAATGALAICGVLSSPATAAPPVAQ
jgi:hypothetical protein